MVAALAVSAAAYPTGIAHANGGHIHLGGVSAAASSGILGFAAVVVGLFGSLVLLRLRRSRMSRRKRDRSNRRSRLD